MNQAGAVGPNATAYNFTQTWQKAADQIDLAALARELATLQNEMGKQAMSTEEKSSVEAVAEAKNHAGTKEGPAVLAALSKAGKWALSVAEKLAVPVAVAAIKVALRLP